MKLILIMNLSNNQLQQNVIALTHSGYNDPALKPLLCEKFGCSMDSSFREFMGKCKVDGLIEFWSPLLQTNTNASALYETVVTDLEARRKMPGILQQAVNFTSSVGREAGAIIDGQSAVSADEIAERVAICDGCQFQVNGRCSRCGCFIGVASRFRSKVCPVGKWPALTKMETK